MRRPLLQRLGYVLTAAGLALLCVAGYRLWGSNLVASRSQAAAVQRLERGWAAELARLRYPASKIDAWRARLDPDTRERIERIQRDDLQRLGS